MSFCSLRTPPPSSILLLLLHPPLPPSLPHSLSPPVSNLFISCAANIKEDCGVKILQVKPAVRALITISRALDPLAPRGRRPKADRIIVTSSAKLLIANDPAELQGWGLAFFILKKKRKIYFIILCELIVFAL